MSVPTNPLRLLIVEDSERDAELILSALGEAGYGVRSRRVQTAEGLRGALREERWDLVTSDFRMPGFDAFGALAVLKDEESDLPCIVVSGTIGEDVAVECMRAGAADYVLKASLARLPAAVERERREADRRAIQRRTERAFDALREVALAAGGPRRPDRLAALAVERVCELLAVDIAAIYWRAEKEDGLVRLASTQTDGEPIVERLMPGEGASGLAFTSRAPVIIPDYANPPPDVRPPLAGLTGSALAVPLGVGERVLGAFFVRSRLRRPFAADEIRSLTLLGTQVAQALELSRSFTELSDSEARFTAYFRSNPVPSVIRRRADGTLIDANAAYCQLVGYSPEELLAQRGSLVADPGQLSALRDRLDRTGHVESEATLRTKSGDLCPVMSFAEPIDVGGEACVIIACVDLTERNRVAALERRQEVLEQASRAKSAFVAAMSHELRTPLNAILGFSQLLLEQLDLSERQRGYLQNVHDAGDQLLDLINDVLDLARIEAGKMELRPEHVALPLLLDPVVAAARLDATAKGLTFVVDVTEDAGLWVDPTRLRQILNNLLSNAVKFTPAPGEVRLRVAVADASLVLEVADTGIGIPAEDHPRVFGTFERLHEGVAAAAGTGLGLALTKQMVKLHGGTITFESAPGAGTTFRVRLPEAVVAQPEAGRPRLDPAGPQPAPAPSGRPIRALIVEDQTMMAELLRANLEGRTDIEVVGLAGTVEEAVRLARSTEPEVIVMDYSLPDGTGAEAAHAIRASGLRSAVLILSSASEREAVESAVIAGAVGYLPKSEPAQVILDAIRRAAAGELLLPPVVLREVARRAQRRWAAADSPLTAREREVVDLESAGRDLPSIARATGLSVQAARRHHLSVMAKLSRSQAAAPGATR